MNVDDTLELDTIIEESSRASNPVSSIKYEGSDSTVHNSKGIQTNTFVFDPQESGNYTITVNGQNLLIKVIDFGMPDSQVLMSDYNAVHRYLFKNQPKPIPDKIGSQDLTFDKANYVSDSKIGNYGLECINDNATQNNESTNSPLADGSALSITGWIKTKSSNGFIYSDGGAEMSLSVSGGKAAIRTYDGSEYIVEGTTSVNNGSWYFIGITYDGSSSGTVYVNGSSENNGSVGYNSRDSWAISGRGSDLGFYDGIVDDIVGYNKELSEAEMTEIFRMY